MSSDFDRLMWYTSILIVRYFQYRQVKKIGGGGGGEIEFADLHNIKILNITGNFSSSVLIFSGIFQYL